METHETKLPTPDINELMAFENGELGVDDTVDLFQRLVNSGLAWQLQGFYGRTASRLINEGLVIPRIKPLKARGNKVSLDKVDWE